jgi:putative inorganic carbon (HCO3(-)) transporter
MSNFKTAAQWTAAFLSRWAWLILLVLAPALLFPSPTRSLALFVVPLLLWAQASATPAPRRTPLDLPILLLAVMVLVSLYATYDIAISLPKIAGMVLGIGTYYTVVRVAQANQHGLRHTLSVYLLSGLGIVGLALSGTRWPSRLGPIADGLNRLPKLLSLPGAEAGLQHNEVAGALLWLVPLALPLAVGAFAKSNLPPAYRIVLKLALVVAPLTALILFFTQSRGGLLAFAATLGVMLMVAGPRVRRIGFAFVVGGGLVTLIAFSAFGPTRLVELIFGSQQQFADASSFDTFAGRLELWSRALYALRDFPFTGMGMNTFRTVVHVMYPLFLTGPEFDVAHAHNEFLQAALDLGIPGLIAFITLYLCTCSMVWSVWRRTVTAASDAHNLTRLLALGLGSSLLAHLVFSFTDAIALGARSGVVFWLLLGLITALYQQREGYSS